MPPRKQTRTNVSARLEDSGLFWENLTKTWILLALILTPLIISTSLSDVWEQPKTLVLSFLMTLAWLSYCLAILRRRSVAWRWHPLDWFALLLAASAVISAAVSVNRTVSIWGIGSWSSDSVPAILSFMSLYLLTGQLFRSRHDHVVGWTSLLTGTGLALLLMMFQFSHVSLLSAAFQSSPLLGTLSSTPSQVAILAGVFGAVALLLWSRTTERWAHWGIVACVAVSWLVLLFMRQPLGWAVLAIGMISVVIDQSLAGRQANVKLLVTAVSLVAVGIILQVTGVANHSSLPPANDILLDQTTSAKTAWTTFLHRPVLGSGPLTWYNDFVQYRPLSFNVSPYWSLRFISAASSWWQELATGGVVMVGLWFGLLGLSVWWIWQQVRRQPQAVLGGTVLVLIVVALTGFVSTWSWVLLLWLWASLGLSRARLTLAAKPTPMGAMAPLLFAAIVFVGLGYWWSAGRVTASDALYQQGRKLYNQVAPIETVIAKLNAAIRLDGRNTNALVLLGNAEVTKAELTAQQSQTTDINALLQPAITHVRQAIAADPNNPALYEEMNNLLNRLTGVISDVAVEANRNFRILEKLEPTNPIHDVGDGQTLMVIRQSLATGQSSATTDSQRQTLLAQAVAAYQRALSKKPDYAQAAFALAQAQAEGGQNTEALQTLDQLNSALAGIGQYWAQRAVVLTNLKQLDLADQAYAQAKKLSPTDALVYSLYATALAKNDQVEKATTTLREGLTAVPNSTALQQQLDQLGK